MKSRVSLAKPTLNGKTMKETSLSSQPTGAGEPSALFCAGCGAQLLDIEVYACGCCLDLWMLLDPNFRLTGETDEQYLQAH